MDRFSVRLSCLANRLVNPKKPKKTIAMRLRWDEGTGAYLWRGRLRSTAAYDIRGGGTAAPLGRDRRGCSRAGGGRGRGRGRRRMRGSLLRGSGDGGRAGPGSGRVLGRGDALAGAGTGRLAS